MVSLNMNCPIGVTGYGITSFNIYKCLRNLDIDITLFPIGQANLDNKDFADNILMDIDKQKTYNKHSPFFKIWHQFDLAMRIGTGKYVALTFFEVDKLKQIEKVMINNTDTILVASEWAKQILLDNDISTEIGVAPLGIDPSIFNESVLSTVKKDNDKYVFLNIGKWEIRKGHDLLVEIFNDAFDKDSNVELWMLNHNPFLTNEENAKWHSLYKNSKLTDKIKLIPRVASHSDVAKVIAMSDCGIFPARSEGWNNEVPEFFALNKPVILTNYSAHTQYANKENSYLLDIDGLTTAKDDKFFDGYGNWADLGSKFYDQAIETMRYVYKNNIRDNPNGLITAKSLTWNNTAEIIKQYIFK